MSPVRLVIAAAFTLLLAAAAAAAETVTGKVDAYDVEARLLTLEDGQEFFLPEDMPTDKLDVGDTVTLIYDEQENGNLLVTKMKVSE